MPTFSFLGPSLRMRPRLTPPPLDVLVVPWESQYTETRFHVGFPIAAVLSPLPAALCPLPEVCGAFCRGCDVQAFGFDIWGQPADFRPARIPYGYVLYVNGALAAM